METPKITTRKTILAIFTARLETLLMLKSDNTLFVRSLIFSVKKLKNNYKTRRARFIIDIEGFAALLEGEDSNYNAMFSIKKLLQGYVVCVKSFLTRLRNQHLWSEKFWTALKS